VALPAVRVVDWHVRGGVMPVMYQGELGKDVRVWPGNNDSSLVDNIIKYDRVPSIPLYVPRGLFAWAENKQLKVLLADLCEKKTLLAG
jgi:hypothetical protein